MSGKKHCTPSWDEYLCAPLPVSPHRQPQCEGGFAAARTCIERLLIQLKPGRVACLGSGSLNDIPMETLFGTADEIYLIDWVPNVSFEGVKQQIIEAAPAARCLFCGCQRPERLCRSFSGVRSDVDLVCKSFCPLEGPSLQCDNYVPGVEPHFVQADVTSGRASRFGRRMEKVVRRSDTPKEAFGRALRESLNCANLHDEMPLKNNAFDFITSSLVASQFDTEPYTFFARLLEDKFGRKELLARQHVLAPMMEDLRTALFQMQIEGHAAEMHRLLDKERGRAYLSVEFFRTLPSGRDFFLVHETPRLLEALGRYFFFDFDALPPEEGARKHAMGSGTSVIQSFVLTPKPEDELAAASPAGFLLRRRTRRP